MLFFVFNSDVVMVLVVHSLSEGEFVAQVPYFPPLQSVSDFPPKVCRSIIEAGAGAHCPDIDIQSVRTWAMRAQVANHFDVNGR